MQGHRLYYCPYTEVRNKLPKVSQRKDLLKRWKHCMELFHKTSCAKADLATATHSQPALCWKCKVFLNGSVLRILISTSHLAVGFKIAKGTGSHKEVCWSLSHCVMLICESVWSTSTARTVSFHHPQMKWLSTTWHFKGPWVKANTRPSLSFCRQASTTFTVYWIPSTLLTPCPVTPCQGAGLRRDTDIMRNQPAKNALVLQGKGKPTYAADRVWSPKDLHLKSGWQSQTEPEPQN